MQCGVMTQSNKRDTNVPRITTVRWSFNHLTIQEPSACFKGQLMTHGNFMWINARSVNMACTGILEELEMSSNSVMHVIVATNCNAPIDLSLMMSSIIGNSMLLDAIIMVTSRPTLQLPMHSFQRTVELYGFPGDSINKRVSIFSANNRELEHFIRKNFEENQNLITYCYIPLQCQFVSRALADVHSQGMDGDCQSSR